MPEENLVTAFLLVIIIVILLAMAGFLGPVFLGLAAIVAVFVLIAYDLLWLAIVVPVAAFLGFLAWVTLDDWRWNQLSPKEREQRMEQARRDTEKRLEEAKIRREIKEKIERRAKLLQDE